VFRAISRLFRSTSKYPAAAQSSFEVPDVYGAGLFPVCPATHDLGLRRLFDLSTLLLLLDCRPGDLVLDLGAGAGFSSEMLVRLGYDVAALDPDLPALGHNRHRMTIDRGRLNGTIHVVQAVAEQLPFSDSSFDGVLAMNVLHHLPDPGEVLPELARVLRPGCRAVLAEPGLDHLTDEETKRAIGEHGEADRPFDVLDFLQKARNCGFKHAMLTATLQPPLRLLPIEEIELYLSGQHPRPHLTPHGVVDELCHRHAYAMIERDGSRPRTSRHPGQLKAELRVDGLPATAARRQPLGFTAYARNVGDTLWEAAPKRRGGFVTIGCKVLTLDGRLVTDRVGRTFLPHDVAPNQTVTAQVVIAWPSDLAAGRYRLQIDLVDEQVCWFADSSPQSAASHILTLQ
jgi:SAM-dependent methyltransferase